MALRHQNVLVTGCSSGIGRALALELSARGHRVFASARAPSALADLPASIDKLALDVTSEASVQAAVDEAVQRAGQLDMVINNAGINLVGPVAELALEELRRLFETNVTGLVAVSQAAVRHMAPRRRGRIVNIGSIIHLLATPFAASYAASKAAVHLLSEGMRMELAPFGIAVIEVQPGGVRSQLAANAEHGLARFAAPGALYRAAYEGIRRRAFASQEGPMEAGHFAAKVCDAILRDRAPRIVRAGKGVHALPAIKRLPGALRDELMAKRFSLDRLRASSVADRP